MVKKIRIACADCKKNRGKHVSNIIPVSEIGFRVNKEKCAVCVSCCKRLNWESKCCLNCSDRSICKNEFPKDFKTFLDKLKGI